MISTYTAFTDCIDDPEQAYAQLESDLRVQGPLLRYSVGILFAYGAFFEEGCAQYIAARLPFDVVGGSTIGICIPGHYGQFGLALMVMTSDDYSFKASMSEPVTDLAQTRARLAAQMGTLLSPAPDAADGPPPDTLIASKPAVPLKPRLLLPILPYSAQVSAEEMMAEVDEAIGGVPAFGTVAASNDPNLRGVYTLLNDTASDDRVVILAISGDFQPDFYTLEFSAKDFISPSAIVTDSDRMLLKGLNGYPVLDFFKAHGFYDGERFMGSAYAASETTAAIFDLEDGSRLVRTIMPLQSDDGLVLTGTAPIGSTMTLVGMSQESVLTDTRALLGRIAAQVQGKSLLAFSCIARNWVLGNHADDEWRIFQELLGARCSFLAASSGGEVFPSRTDNGALIDNHLQNFSLTICAFS
jgi:hypothetical protein